MAETHPNQALAPVKAATAPTLSITQLLSEVQCLDGEIEMIVLQRGRILKQIRNASEQSFRDGLAERGMTIEDGEALIRNFERSQVKQ